MKDNRNRRFDVLITQDAILPGIVKPRHLVSTQTPVEGEIFYSDGTVFKQQSILTLDITNDRILISNSDTYLFRESASALRTNSTFTADGDIIAVGGSTSTLRIYRDDGEIVFRGASGYDTNLYASAANTLATDDDLKFVTATKGVILKDRTTATFYRLYVDSGTLKIEAV